MSFSTVFTVFLMAMIFSFSVHATGIEEYNTNGRYSTGDVGIRAHAWIRTETEEGGVLKYRYYYTLVNNGTVELFVRWQFIDLAVEVTEVLSRNGDFISVNAVYLKLSPGVSRTFSFVSDYPPAMDKNIGATWPEQISCPLWIHHQKGKDIWVLDSIIGMDGYLPVDWGLKMEITNDHVCNFHPEREHYYP